MSTFTLDLQTMDGSDARTHPDGPGWVRDGVLGRGDLLLLTGVWKAGKTTLLAGLFRALGGGGGNRRRLAAQMRRPGPVSEVVDE